MQPALEKTLEATTAQTGLQAKTSCPTSMQLSDGVVGSTALILIVCPSVPRLCKFKLFQLYVPNHFSNLRVTNGRSLASGIAAARGTNNREIRKVAKNHGPSELTSPGWRVRPKHIFFATSTHCQDCSDSFGRKSSPMPISRLHRESRGTTSCVGGDLETSGFSASTKTDPVSCCCNRLPILAYNSI